MANLSKASNVVQEKYILYDVTGFTQKWHSIPVATNCTHGVCMIVSGGEGVLGADWGLGTWRVWIHTITGRRASVEIQSLVELIFLPTSLVEQWLQ